MVGGGTKARGEVGGRNNTARAEGPHKLRLRPRLVVRMPASGRENRHAAHDETRQRKRRETDKRHAKPGGRLSDKEPVWQLVRVQIDGDRHAGRLLAIALSW